MSFRTPVFTAVDIVMREQDALAGCSHVAEMVSEYLDVSHKWTIERAACAGYMTLLERLERGGAGRDISGSLVSKRTPTERHAAGSAKTPSATDEHGSIVPELSLDRTARRERPSNYQLQK
ncbi:hypothetical protein Pcac1_g16861 [Phytophthora cactorum]|nr:hypothetical protein Pcac1_g16861 [Phytophthora cactorum]